MYAVYQNKRRVSPVFNGILEAGDWQSKFSSCLLNLEVIEFEFARRKDTPQLKRVRAKIKAFRKDQTKPRGRSS